LYYKEFSYSLYGGKLDGHTNSLSIICSILGGFQLQRISVCDLIRASFMDNHTWFDCAECGGSTFKSCCN
jgi:hypothetical protein